MSEPFITYCAKEARAFNYQSSQEPGGLWTTTIKIPATCWQAELGFTEHAEVFAWYQDNPSKNRRSLGRENGQPHVSVACEHGHLLAEGWFNRFTLHH